MHARLLQSGRGGTKNPGDSAVFKIGSAALAPGNALFVPPPVAELDACLDQFERFIHEDVSRLPPLIKAGLLHVQFETLHPFLDGNRPHRPPPGILYLCVQDVLRKPLLYLSLYLKTHRATITASWRSNGESGAWEAWLEFFLVGVAETANQAFEAATRIVELFKHDRELITTQSDRVGSALRIDDLLQQNPFANAGALVEHTGVFRADHQRGARGSAKARHRRGSDPGRRRGRVFGYRAYLDILNEGTASLPAAG